MNGSLLFWRIRPCWMADSRKKDRQNKALVDEISATIILQSYLESKKYIK